MRKTIFTTTILLFILFPLALAESGCFLHPESPLFCQELVNLEAEEECLFLEDCDLQAHFIENELCEVLEECQKVVCKNSCLEEYSGRCPEEAPEGWCISGCCQFNYGTDEFCQFTDNQRVCEIEATNQNVAQFVFIKNLDQSSCQQQCSKGTLIAENQKVPPSDTNENNQTGTVSGIDLSSRFWLTLIIILALIGFFYFLHKKHFLRSLLSANKQDETEQSNRKPWYFPFPTKASQRIKKLKLQHQHKVKHQKRENLLLEKGLLPKRLPEDHFKRLARIAKHSKKKQNLKKNSIFDRLNELVKK